MATDTAHSGLATANREIANWRKAQRKPATVAVASLVVKAKTPAVSAREHADALAAMGHYELALTEYQRAAAASSAAWDRMSCQLRLRVNAEGAPILAPGSDIERLEPGQVVRVTRVAGDWLWVEVEQLDKLPRDRQSQSGWIARKDVASVAP